MKLRMDDPVELGDALIDVTDALAGRLLIAMPGIGDPRFERAVILMVSHTEEEAMGPRALGGGAKAWP